ncbi:MAG TPA: lyase family protein, partial [Saprospiraceae bacterium]|nr:lyase family protein [Saprospiraceae bacterium]
MLQALSPVDGRYFNSTKVLRKYFSEHALIYYRVFVEVKYLSILLNENDVKLNSSKELNHFLDDIIENFCEADAESIKATEKITNHDVKAVEYFIREKLKSAGFHDILPFVHFGLTSQDINNTAF